MATRIFGYIRISSADQNEARQIDALLNAGVEKRDIYTDKKSGKDFNRDDYNALVRSLREGDTLIIKSIDRIGRNYSEILEQWKLITKEIKAHIKVLDMPLLDTTTASNDLTSTLISDIVLQILSYVAETERIHIRQRQSEGIKLAKERGIHLGRPKAVYPSNFNKVYKEWQNKEITAVVAMKKLNLKKSTFYKLVNNYVGNLDHISSS